MNSTISVNQKDSRDPIIQEVDTLPKAKYTSILPMKGPRQVSPDKMVIGITIPGLIISLIPSAVGIILIVVNIIAQIRPDIVLDWSSKNQTYLSVPQTILGIAIVIAGVKLLMYMAKRVVFNSATRSITGIENLTYSSIHAFQFIIVDNGANTELNLITSDSRRIHLFSGPGVEKMERKALEFSQFFGKPIVKVEVIKENIFENRKK